MPTKGGAHRRHADMRLRSANYFVDVRPHLVEKPANNSCRCRRGAFDALSTLISTDRLVERIVEVAWGRATKGDAFSCMTQPRAG